MRELYLVRHCESEHHVRGMTGGWTDLPLTDRGRRQAVAVARRLAELEVDREARLYSSDLTRARETAEPIGATLELPISFTAGLREMNNGVARGLSAAEAAMLRRPLTEPKLDWIPHDGGESWRAFHQRVCRCLDELDRREPGVVVAVTHGLSLICAVNWWLRIDDDRLLTNTMYDAAPASITKLRIDRDHCRAIAFLNDTSHLRELER